MKVAIRNSRLFMRQHCWKKKNKGREKDGVVTNGIQHERWRMQNVPCVLDSGYREANRSVLETDRLDGHR